LKKHFVTFASSDLQITLLRIKMQAAKSGTFDHIHCFTEDMLAPEFRKHFSSRLWLGTRGFGYWCWKPQILLQTIQKAQDGDLYFIVMLGAKLMLMEAMFCRAILVTLKKAKMALLSFS